jgi:hypothetical protein
VALVFDEARLGSRRARKKRAAGEIAGDLAVMLRGRWQCGQPSPISAPHETRKRAARDDPRLDAEVHPPWDFYDEIRSRFIDEHVMAGCR